MITNNTTTILFITGAFVSHHCWDKWITLYKSRGFNTLAPPWPHKQGTAAQLRALQPKDTALAKLTFAEVVEHYAQIIQALPEKPIVVGHSIGGLIVQLLVNRGLVKAGVAINSVPPRGVVSFEWSVIKGIWKPLGFFTAATKTYLMSLSEWKRAYTNGMPEEEQCTAYDENIIPESKRVLRGTLGKDARVDFKKPHVPLLFISGDDDPVIPASLNADNYLKYETPNSITDYKEFQRKSHFTQGLPSWNEEADFILDWLQVLDLKPVLV